MKKILLSIICLGCFFYIKSAELQIRTLSILPEITDDNFGPKAKSLAEKFASLDQVGDEESFENLYNLWRLDLDKFLNLTQQLALPNLALNVVKRDINNPGVSIERDTPLLYALKTDFDALAKLLVGSNASFIVPNAAGQNALSLAATKNKHEVLAEIFKQHPDWSGQTLIQEAFLCAVHNNNRDARDVLLERLKKLDISSQESCIQKALLIAVNNDYRETRNALLAQVKMLDIPAQGVVYHSLKYRWGHLLLRSNVLSKAIEFRDVTFFQNVLKDKEYKPLLTTNVLSVALLAAVMHLNVDAVEKLLKAGAGESEFKHGTESIERVSAVGRLPYTIPFTEARNRSNNISELLKNVLVNNSINVYPNS